jgi:cbb3-type cytochrome oxidase subunit 3
MKTEALSQFPLGWLTGVALLLFFSVFVMIVWWTYHAKNKPALERWARIPLEQDGQHE